MPVYEGRRPGWRKAECCGALLLLLLLLLLPLREFEGVGAVRTKTGQAQLIQGRFEKRERQQKAIYAYKTNLTCCWANERLLKIAKNAAQWRWLRDQDMPGRTCYLHIIVAR
jgi:hypothetical protein